MFQLVLIDDETGQLEMMAEIIRAAAEDFEVKAFSQPAAALSYIACNRADAVVSDIRMPQMDGLELAQRLRARFPDIVMAILSAHSDFAYAQRAIEAGVVTYLVKPLSRAKISEMMDKIRRQLVKAQQMEGMKRLKQSRQLQAWLAGGLDAESAHEIGAMFGGLPWGFWTATEILPPKPCGERERAALELELGRRMQAAFAGGKVLTVPLEEDGLRLACAAAFPARPAWEEVLPALRRVISGLCAPYPVYMGVGDISAQFLEDPKAQFQEAERLLRCRFILPGQPLFTAQQQRRQKPLEPACFYALERNLADALCRADSALAQRHLEAFSNTYTDGEYCAQPQQVMEAFSHIAYTLNKQWGYAAPDDMAKALRGAATLPAACACLGAYIARLVRLRRERDTGTTQDMVRGVQQYIRQNYAKELTLEQVAEHFHFNATYLSSIFKQYAQTGFKEYVTQVRIERSKSLLRETGLRVYEVARQCGYPDAAYFVRLFKKEVGVSPSRYRGVAG